MGFAPSCFKVPSAFIELNDAVLSKFQMGFSKIDMPNFGEISRVELGSAWDSGNVVLTRKQSSL